MLMIQIVIQIVTKSHLLMEVDHKKSNSRIPQ